MQLHFSRLPVYDKTIDSIVGIIHEKNFFSMYFEGKSDISEIMQKPIYIFELTSISELMQEMQKTKSHMAVVIDQYGGTEGIVTMEDIIEELVGEIYDETDEEDRSFVDLGGGVYEVSGDFSVRDFAERAGLSENEIDTDCNSVGGWVMELLDHIPEQGEAVTTGRVTMTVLSTVDDQRIDRIRADVKPLEDEESKLKSDERLKKKSSHKKETRRLFLGNCRGFLLFFLHIFNSVAYILHPHIHQADFFGAKPQFFG